VSRLGRLRSIVHLVELSLWILVCAAQRRRRHRKEGRISMFESDRIGWTDSLFSKYTKDI
jgi:hypothetical protein